MKNKYGSTDENDELVQMHVHSTDDAFHFLVNAVRWFERSSDEEIVALLEGERNEAGHFTGEAARIVALELALDIDVALVLAYAKFNAERYVVIVDRLTTARWIRKHRSHLTGFLVPPELLASLPTVVGEQPGVLFLDDMSSIVWDEPTRIVRHFNFENEVVREWRPDDEGYDHVLDLFTQFPLPRDDE